TAIKNFAVSARRKLIAMAADKAGRIGITATTIAEPSSSGSQFAIFPTGCKLPKLFDFKHMRRLRVQVAFGAPLSGANTDADSLNEKLHDVISVL
ncbi:MAG: hypothetical protein RSB47_08375, partial [Ruthenibacterium sp.]